MKQMTAKAELILYLLGVPLLVSAEFSSMAPSKISIEKSTAPAVSKVDVFGEAETLSLLESTPALGSTLVDFLPPSGPVSEGENGLLTIDRPFFDGLDKELLKLFLPDRSRVSDPRSVRLATPPFVQMESPEYRGPIKSWKLSVKSARGEEVFSLPGFGFPPPRASWSGFSKDLSLVPGESYLALMELIPVQGEAVRSERVFQYSQIQFEIEGSTHVVVHADPLFFVNSSRWVEDRDLQLRDVFESLRTHYRSSVSLTYYDSSAVAGGRIRKWVSLIAETLGIPEDSIEFKSVQPRAPGFSHADIELKGGK